MKKETVISEEMFRVCSYIMQGFTRQETLLLTGITSSRLAYLDRAKLIVPKKHGNSKKPYVMYAWVQLIQIRAIAHLKQQVSLAAMQKIVDFFDTCGFDEDWQHNHLVVAGDEAFVSKPDWSSMPGIIQAAAKKNHAQLTVIVFPQIDRVVSDIWDVARNSGAIDMETFEARSKLTYTVR